ncbi:16S rRNA (guanine(527)-N(7))-methyltransferase RsmG [Nocardioides plantarum]|uniref:Ribosomal RNA small subunit methyltransferase G n=1 Tax=Nocardioides plantarum TaxID=29299 RepID=A0ABV5KF88_9ACTN|nr:16S rRNA (guanine(527)-N(7))-methyltransferase RsmG [Nocardioides plantarum]
MAYADLLASAGVVRGLIGPRETPRLWSRHLLNSAVLAEQVPPGATVADVGSGAGLPGLPLAIARPDATITLIEPLLRRATFLQEAVELLGLSNVRVIRARGEDLHRSPDLVPGFGVVTSRAVATLSQLVDWCMPLVEPHGALVALKGDTAAQEVLDSQRTLSSWGCAQPQVLTLGGTTLAEPTSAVRVEWARPESVSWPARPERRRPSSSSRRRRSGRP